METPTPSQKLDAILGILANHLNAPKNTFVTHASIKEFLKDIATPNEVTLALKKLIKEGYAISDDKTNSFIAYNVTFDGMVLFESGGYHKKIVIDAQNEKRIIRNENLLIKGTWAAAIAAAFVLCWQIFLYFYPVHNDYSYWIWETIPQIKK